MATISGLTTPFPQPLNRQRPAKPSHRIPVTGLENSETTPESISPCASAGRGSSTALVAAPERSQKRRIIDWEKVREREARERKEEVNRKIASQKAISVILRREATKAIIEKKRGPTNSKKLLPRTVLEALHERITALRWQSALKVFELLREQLWYRPSPGVYVKLIVMLGKCKQPEKAHELFQAMIDEGCIVNHESYTAMLSAYSRSGLFDKAFSLLEEMKDTPYCQPDVQTYSILIKSCLQVFAFDKVQAVLSDMASLGIRPNLVTYNTVIDAYGKAKMFLEMEATLVDMLSQQNCKPDVWTMNSTLRAFGGSGQIEMMEKCYEKFQSAGIEPNIKTFNILLDSYAKAENYEKMSAVMEYMQKYHYSWTIVTYNVLIDAFGRAGDLKQMEYLFRLMQSERIKPSCVTLCSLVRAYGRAEKPEKIGSVLRFIENSDVTLDTVFFNCLVDAYGRMGCFAEMKGVLELMEQKRCKPDKVTYRTMINAYSSKGMTSHVKKLLDLLGSAKMTRMQKTKPDF
uniref:Pentatricopeptide repeat-containing protein n=3 Tax=Rhizophora mucronata TaxID=61149 RepID=A0A2P2JB27_RHIMU